MKGNSVSKHLFRFNKPRIEKDRKREQKLRPKKQKSYEECY